ADDPRTARLMGIDANHVYALAMGLSFGIIAIAGVFAGIKGIFTPDLGPSFLIFAFEAVVIGGLGSFWGTFAGSLILGLAQVIGFHIDPGWGVLAGHFCFLFILLIKPTGLFARTHA